MKVFFGQIYVEVGASFPFSTRMQTRLSAKVTELVDPSKSFGAKYGLDWSLMFRISAKRNTGRSEIRGPSIYRKSKQMEYSIFLPFDVLIQSDDAARAALKTLLLSVCDTLEQLECCTENLRAKGGEIVETICSDPECFDRSQYR